MDLPIRFVVILNVGLKETHTYGIYSTIRCMVSAQQVSYHCWLLVLHLLRVDT